MMRKQYIAPELSIELLATTQTILFVSGSSDDNDYTGGGFDPKSGAPKRISTMYI